MRRWIRRAERARDALSGATRCVGGGDVSRVGFAAKPECTEKLIIPPNRPLWSVEFYSLQATMEGCH